MIQSTVIDIQSLGKTYREGLLFKRTFTALNDVSLQVRSGEVFGLLGPNGAGKTTMIKILLGILSPSKGQATVLGQPAGSMAARRRIGYLPENLAFPRHHTGRSALYFYARLNGVAESEIRRKEPELLKLVDLFGREEEPVRKYSKGMKQRLGLAQALIHDPDVLIMDEPTDGLDPIGRSQIRSVIERLRGDGKTIFLNSHILQEVELICDRVAILARGTLKGLGTIGELTSKFRASVALHVSMTVIGDRVHVEGLLSQLAQEIQPFQHQPLRPAASSESSAGENAWDFSVAVRDQQSIDLLVDRLRKLGVSLLRIEPTKARLEDVFMSVVESVGYAFSENQAS